MTFAAATGPSLSPLSSGIVVRAEATDAFALALSGILVLPTVAAPMVRNGDTPVTQEPPGLSSPEAAKRGAPAKAPSAASTQTAGQSHVQPPRPTSTLQAAAGPAVTSTPSALASPVAGSTDLSILDTVPFTRHGPAASPSTTAGRTASAPQVGPSAIEPALCPSPVPVDAESATAPACPATTERVAPSRHRARSSSASGSQPNGRHAADNPVPGLPAILAVQILPAPMAIRPVSASKDIAAPVTDAAVDGVATDSAVRTTLGRVGTPAPTAAPASPRQVMSASPEQPAATALPITPPTIPSAFALGPVASTEPPIQPATMRPEQAGTDPAAAGPAQPNVLPAHGIGPARADTNGPSIPKTIAAADGVAPFPPSQALPPVQPSTAATLRSSPVEQRSGTNRVAVSPDIPAAQGLRPALAMRTTPTAADTSDPASGAWASDTDDTAIGDQSSGDAAQVVAGGSTEMPHVRPIATAQSGDTADIFGPAEPEATLSAPARVEPAAASPVSPEVAPGSWFGQVATAPLSLSPPAGGVQGKAIPASIASISASPSTAPQPAAASSNRTDGRRPTGLLASGAGDASRSSGWTPQPLPPADAMEAPDRVILPRSKLSKPVSPANGAPDTIGGAPAVGTIPATTPDPVPAMAPPSRANAPDTATAVSRLAADMPLVVAQPGRIGQDMGVAIVHRLAAGEQELVVRLEPATLGRIEVRMAFDDQGGLRAVIAADSPLALDMLRRDSADLSRALNDAGIRNDGQSLRFQNDGSGGGGGGGQPRNPWLSADRTTGPSAADRSAADDLAPLPYRPVRLGGRYDLMA